MTTSTGAYHCMQKSNPAGHRMIAEFDDLNTKLNCSQMCCLKNCEVFLVTHVHFDLILLSITDMLESIKNSFSKQNTIVSYENLLINIFIFRAKVAILNHKSLIFETPRKSLIKNEIPLSSQPASFTKVHYYFYFYNPWLTKSTNLKKRGHNNLLSFVFVNIGNTKFW